MKGLFAIAIALVCALAAPLSAHAKTGDDKKLELQRKKDEAKKKAEERKSRVAEERKAEEARKQAAANQCSPT